jgi:hypothetical protein
METRKGYIMAKILTSESQIKEILERDYIGLINIIMKYKMESSDTAKIITLIETGGKKEPIKIEIVA